ncbi:MAG: translocation/assembly module TamB domain-containing protein [Candidatus Zixiibacteriota bacterium]|nr:MAG: translocation/assembly module TamB domain-containing protein [candidate division Zixibacteria bacterium]
MRRLIKILFLTLCALIVIAGAAVAYFLLLGGLERSVNAQISSFIGQDSPLSARVGNIKGNIISGVVIEDISVRYFDSVYNYEVMHIGSTTAGYSISNLWNKNYILSYLYLDSVRVTVLRDSLNNLVWPKTTDAGSNGAGVDFRVDRMQVSRGLLSVISHSDATIVNDIVLSGAVRADEGTYSVAINQLSFDSNRGDIKLDAASGDLTISGKHLLVQDLSAVFQGTRVKASGSVNFEDFSGRTDFSADHIDLERLGRYIGPPLKGVLDLNGSVVFDKERIGGSVDIGGTFMMARLENLFARFEVSNKLLALDTLYGAILEGCGIDGRGWIDFSGNPESYELDAKISNFNLQHLVPGSFESDLSGQINLKGSSFREADMELTVDALFRNSEFDEYPVQFADGTARITTNSITFLHPFRVDYYENEFTASGEVVYSGGMDLAVEARLENLDRYRGKLFIDQPGGRGLARARLTGRSSDPNLQGWFESDSLWLYGVYADTMRADFDIDRFLTGRDGKVSARFRSGKIYPVPYDSTHLNLRLDSVLAFIDSVHVFSPQADGLAAGTLNYGIYPQELILDTVSLNLFERDFDNQGPVHVAIDSSGFIFRRTDIAGETAELILGGRIDFNETMDATLTITQVPIRPWLQLFMDTVEVDGYLSCEADLAGSFSYPRIGFDGRVDSLVLEQLPAVDLTTTAHYANERLTIDSLVVLSDSGIYRGDGYLYLDLAFAARSIDRVLDREMDLHLNGRDRKFDLVFYFLPSVEDLSGEFWTDVHLSGTPSEPHLEGTAFLRDARLKYFDIANIIYADSVGVTMHDNQIIIDSGLVYEKDRRRNDEPRYAVISGAITVKSLDNFHYDLAVNVLPDFPFEYDLENINGIIEGTLHIRGDTPPTVTGDLSLSRMMYLADFAGADEGSPIMAALMGVTSWDLDLNIDIPSNYWIKNDRIDAEFAGQMNLIREQGRIRFQGELEILRGKGYLFDKTFRIEPDSRVVFEDEEYPNPRLDIVANTRVPGVRFAEEEHRESQEITIHVTGTLDYPEFGVASGDTAFTREDILPWIVANQYPGQEGSNGIFEQRLATFIGSEVSKIGSQQLSNVDLLGVGVETFEIAPAYGPDADLSQTQFTLGLSYGPSLYVYMGSDVSSDPNRQWGFEYRFNRSLMLLGRQDEDKLYHLNLNLHWEF